MWQHRLKTFLKQVFMKIRGTYINTIIVQGKTGFFKISAQWKPNIIILFFIFIIFMVLILFIQLFLQFCVLYRYSYKFIFP